MLMSDLRLVVAAAANAGTHVALVKGFVPVRELSTVRTIKSIPALLGNGS